MNFKKILAGAVASVLAVSSLAVFASAEDGEFEWELAGQFDKSFNEAEEWPTGVKGTGKIGEEITAVWEFDDNVKLAANYFGFKTVGVAWSNEEGAVNPTMDIISFKVDGNEVAVDNDKFHHNHTDNDSASGNLKAVFYNEWDDNCAGNPAIDVEAVNGEEGFTKLEVVFKVNGVAGTADDPADTTSGDGNNDPAGDDNKPAGDKNNAETGVEGVAVVAGLAVIAAGAVVVAKKRK